MKEYLMVKDVFQPRGFNSTNNLNSKTSFFELIKINVEAFWENK